MNFLYPGFLFSLLAIAIPILIHLFNFKRFRKVYFSNVQFLKEVEQKNSSRQKLRNLLILISRILAIIFLVLAFAQPYIVRENELAKGGEQVVGVYLDNSFSMESVGKEGSLLEAAKRRATEIATSYNLNSKFLLLTNDFAGRHQRLVSRDEFISMVDEVEISSATRKLQEVVNRQQEFLSEISGRKAVYLLSDFQKNMFDVNSIAAESRVAVRLIRLESNPLSNITIDSAWFDSPIHKPFSTERLVVKLKNNSDEAASNIPIKLNVDGQQKAIGSLSLAPRKEGNDTLSFSGLKPGWHRAQISITDYPVVFDDNYSLAFVVRENVPVLSINDTLPNKYLNAVFKADNFFRLVNTTSGSIDYSSLKNYPLIIFNGVEVISAGLSQQLTSYVRNGGSIMIYPSLAGDLNELAGFLRTLGADVPEQIVNVETKVNDINLSHPLFKNVFDRIPSNLDLPTVKKFIEYTGRSKSNKQRILELTGRRSFLSQYTLGEGKIYLSAVPLEEEVTNFGRHSIFVPVMYQAVFLSLREGRLSYILGRDQFLETKKTTLKGNQVLKLKKGRFETIPDLHQTETATRLFIADQVKEEGVYELLAGDSLQGLFAFNNNRLESELTYADDNTIASKFSQLELDIITSGKQSVENTIKTAANGSSLWKLCIILSLICIATEILLIRFFKTQY